MTKTGAELNATLGMVIEGNLGTLLFTAMGDAVKVLCTTVTLVGMSLIGTGSLTNGAKAEFSGCDTSSAGCTPKSNGTAVGKILTNALKGLLVLIGTTTRVRIEPQVGETLVTINMGEECLVGESIPVRGKIALEVTQVGTHSVKHLIQEDAANTHIWVLNLIAEHQAAIDGTAEAFLTGGHNGLSWSGDPA